MSLDYRKKPYLQLHFVVFISGFTAILGSVINLPPLEVVFYRTLMAGIGLYGLMRVKKISPIVNNKDLFKLLGTGFIIGGHWITFFLAARLSNISICLAGLATTSLWTSFLEPLVYKKKINWIEPFLGVMSAFGIVLIYNSSFDNALGLSIAILSALLAAIFSVVNSKLVVDRNHYTISMYEMWGACIVSLILLVVFNLTGLIEEISLVSNLMDLFYLSILAGVCTVYTYSLWVKLMKKLSPFTINLTINLEPIYGIILAFLLFSEKEQMNFNFYLGISFILSSVFIYPFITKRQYAS